jgi:periplasmic protein TonB
MKTKKLILLASLLLVLVSYPGWAQEKNENDKVYYNVDQMPEFPGGKDALTKFIAENIVYPDDAKKDGVQGKVFVSFTVDKKGEVKNAEIARGVHTLLDNEAVRVIDELPAWKPGKQDGNVVDVRFTMPIQFALAADKNE